MPALLLAYRPFACRLLAVCCTLWSFSLILDPSARAQEKGWPLPPEPPALRVAPSSEVLEIAPAPGRTTATSLAGLVLSLPVGMPSADAAGPASPAAEDRPPVAAIPVPSVTPDPEILAQAVDLDRAAGSPGCGVAAPETPPDAVMSDGRQRSLITVVPENYDPTRLHRLVIAFHGRTNSNTQVRRYYGIEGHGGRPTIFVYPAGLGGGSGGYMWWNGSPGGGEAEDYALFDTLVEEMRFAYCIDETAIFAVGHSLGGSFVTSLACSRGDLLRGVAAVGGGFVAGDTCLGGVAALLMHNREDRLSPIEWGESARDRILAENRLTRVSFPAEPGDYNCRRYGDEGIANPVIWCEHPFSYSSGGRYYPHTWPDGAGQVVMRFFDALE